MLGQLKRHSLRLHLVVLPILLAVILSALVPGLSSVHDLAAPAAAQSVPPAVVVTVPRLNVRAGPGITYEVIDQVTQGTVLPVLGYSPAGDWLNVITPRNITGWVSAAYVQGQASSDVPSSVPSQPPAGNLPPYVGKPFTPDSFTRGNAYIVECFGSGESRLREVNSGTPVQVIAQGDFVPEGIEGEKLGPPPYVKIRIWDGQYGWMALSNIAVDPNSVPRGSSICEDYDRIDWTKVVRPTPVPPPPQYEPPSSGGSSSRSGCCAICTRGKACGDACIPRSHKCHVGPGCACNG